MTEAPQVRSRDPTAVPAADRVEPALEEHRDESHDKAQGSATRNSIRPRLLDGQSSRGGRVALAARSRNEYLPRTLRWWRRNGESRATSSSRTLRPAARNCGPGSPAGFAWDFWIGPSASSSAARTEARVRRFAGPRACPAVGPASVSSGYVVAARGRPPRVESRSSRSTAFDDCSVAEDVASLGRAEEYEAIVAVPQSPAQTFRSQAPALSASTHGDWVTGDRGRGTGDG